MCTSYCISYIIFILYIWCRHIKINWLLHAPGKIRILAKRNNNLHTIFIKVRCMDWSAKFLCTSITDTISRFTWNVRLVYFTEQRTQNISPNCLYNNKLIWSYLRSHSFSGKVSAKLVLPSAWRLHAGKVFL